MASRRYLVIVNPASGRRRGRQVLQQVRPVFEQAGASLDVRICEARRHAFNIISGLDLQGYDGCCVIGGDGTVHEVVNGLLHRPDPVPVPLGLIPAGSGNTLHLHQGGQQPVEAVQKILAGNSRPLDVARVSMGDDVVYCVNIVGWAAVVDINHWAERLRLLGPIRYGVAALAFIIRPRRRFARLVLDGRVDEDEFVFVIGCNTAFTGNGMHIAPRADLHDGQIDVVVVRDASRLEMLRLFQRVFQGSHVLLPFVEYYQVRKFAISHDTQQPLDLDGESIGQAPFEVEVLPSVLTVFA